MGNPVQRSNVKKNPIYGKTVVCNIEEILCEMRLLMLLLLEVSWIMFLDCSGCLAPTI
jgi:hypothetical protein